MNKTVVCKNFYVVFRIKGVDKVFCKTWVMEKRFIPAVFIRYNKKVIVVFLHKKGCQLQWLVFADGNKIFFHVVFNFWRHVRNKFRRFCIKPVENIFCLRRKFSCTARLIVFVPCWIFKFCKSVRTDNRICIRILMSKNIGCRFHFIPL